MTEATFPNVKYETKDWICTITLNRPEVMNAVDNATGADIEAALSLAARDPDARVVIVTGEGRGFCAGGNMKSLGSPDQRDPVAVKWGSDPSWNGYDLRSRRLLRSAEGWTQMSTMSKPTIAMVNGPVVGAGCSLALAADFRIASDRSSFNSGYVARGLSGDVGGAWSAVNVLGPAKAREFLFFPRTIPADECLRMGLVNRVVPHEKLLEETMAMARELADGPPVAYAHLKENIDAAVQLHMHAALDIEARNFARCLNSEDCKEAVGAFLEKRKPVYKGR
ncbi:MAG: enoyl-CoA hydratase/isomerase family protein [Gammaproteobacteria bacterium]